MVRIVLNKPIYVGFSTLEISKWLMYDFHYNIMMKRYDDRLTLLYTDTVSLTNCTQSEDIFQEVSTHLDDFDTSEYPTDHLCYRATNAKTLGKFKAEVKGNIIKEFIGLRPKLYCMVAGSTDSADNIIKQAKGISKGFVKHQFTVDVYRRCLMNKERMYTLTTNFKNSFYDKRYLLPDRVNTLPSGNCDIPPRD